MIAQREIEAFLLDAADWVSAEAICARFRIGGRTLRAGGRRPGLLDGFAVSDSRLGYKHVALLSTEEYLAAKHRVRKHGVGEIRKTRAWDRARANVLTGPLHARFERHSGQGVLL